MTPPPPPLLTRPLAGGAVGEPTAHRAMRRSTRKREETPKAKQIKQTKLPRVLHLARRGEKRPPRRPAVSLGDYAPLVDSDTPVEANDQEPAAGTEKEKDLAQIGSSESQDPRKSAPVSAEPVVESHTLQELWKHVLKDHPAHKLGSALGDGNCLLNSIAQQPGVTFGPAALRHLCMTSTALPAGWGDELIRIRATPIAPGPNSPTKVIFPLDTLTQDEIEPYIKRHSVDKSHCGTLEAQALCVALGRRFDLCTSTGMRTTLTPEKGFVGPPIVLLHTGDGESGHWQPALPQAQKIGPPLSAASPDRVCTSCNLRGHTRPNCPTLAAAPKTGRGRCSICGIYGHNKKSHCTVCNRVAPEHDAGCTQAPLEFPFRDSAVATVNDWSITFAMKDGDIPSSYPGRVETVCNDVLDTSNPRKV